LELYDDAWTCKLETESVKKLSTCEILTQKKRTVTASTEFFKKMICMTEHTSINKFCNH
jgi:hypothetical protein